MAKIIVKNKDVESAIRNFKRITSETRKDTKKHEFYVKPGLKAREKSKLAEKKRRISMRKRRS